MIIINYKYYIIDTMIQQRTNKFTLLTSAIECFY